MGSILLTILLIGVGFLLFVEAYDNRYHQLVDQAISAEYLIMHYRTSKVLESATTCELDRNAIVLKLLDNEAEYLRQQYPDTYDKMHRLFEDKEEAQMKMAKNDQDYCIKQIREIQEELSEIKNSRVMVLGAKLFKETRSVEKIYNDTISILNQDDE